MIYWKDFALDSDLGPYLALIDGDNDPVIRVKRSDSGRRNQDDAGGKLSENASRSQIQETGQGQQPARMVGLSSSALSRTETFALQSRLTNASDMEVEHDGTSLARITNTSQSSGFGPI